MRPTKPLARGVYHAPYRRRDGAVYLFAVDGTGTLVSEAIVPRAMESQACRALWEVLDKEDGGGESGSTEDGRLQNEHLRLLREDVWSNTGELYRVWELLHDCPQVPVFRVSGVRGKRHAQQGDELWEEAGDDDTPFRLKRNGRRIGSPEWWMVRELFDGLPDMGTATVDSGSDEAPEDEAPVPLDPRESRVVPGGVVRRVGPRGGCPGAGLLGYVYAATRAVPELRISEGDLLVQAG